MKFAFQLQRIQCGKNGNMFLFYTYLETLNGANDISADPPIKSPIIPFQFSAAQKYHMKISLIFFMKLHMLT